ncbi:hypothetical protein [Xenophilus sp. Marseille-Q4582]|uniref:hypothetical protein n=1 Tax=Xenophilus sp. Marseille-Q4582 TaxID=2866600 RepID=UPI001CE3F9BB|nr:hypothetical protein [Xenophilus sp. Marseille-Q4582]
MSPGVLFTVLSNIPWGQVIDNAPKVAEGATRLWNTVGARRRKPAAAAAPDESPGDGAAVTHTPAEALQRKVEALEAEVRQLSEQMQASSELIKALADQNTLLVQRIELHRRRMRQLAAGGLAVAATLTAAGLYVLLRA